MLTPAQKTALKNFIAADNTLNAFANDESGAFAIAALMDVAASPDFFVYRPNVPVHDIYDQVQWSKLTPADAVPTDTALNAAVWQARSLACQGKQFNLQTMVMGQQTINASKSNVRAGLQDALTNVPSAASGVTQAAGWVGVRDNALARKATRTEKLFADTAGGNGAAAATAAVLVIEGKLSIADIVDARNNG